MLTFTYILLLLLFLFGILYIYYKYKFNYWKARGVPCKQPTFFFGNLLELVLSGAPPTEYIAKLYNEVEGSYFGFYCLTKPFLFIKDPNLIRNVLIKDFDIFSNRHIHTDEKIETILCNSLVALKTPYWRTLRKKLSHAFATGKIKTMMHLITECGENLEKYVSNMAGKDIEMKEVAARYTTDVIATCAFGVNANTLVNEDSEIRAYGKLLFPNTAIDVLKYTSYFLAPTIVKIFKYPFVNAQATKFFSKLFTTVISDRELSNVKRKDFIDILIEAKNAENHDDNFKFDGDRLVAQAVIFYGVGHETSSATIAFTLHELCVNTHIQDRLRMEIESEIEENCELTYEVLQNMKYLHMIISETLRKYPLTPFLNRECGRDYKVENTGLVIEKGTPVLISQQALHWNPKYFPNPEKYDPERFNEENKQKVPNYAYIPFGDGPRICIGERFALISTKLAIIHIIKNFKVTKNSETREPLVPGMSPMKPKYGVHLTCTKL